MKDALIYYILSIVILRWLFLGYVISRNGEERKPEKYSADKHLFKTLIWCWMLYVVSYY